MTKKAEAAYALQFHREELPRQRQSNGVYFASYLTVEQEKPTATAADITQCFG
jgi:hypothetical protein